MLEMKASAAALPLLLVFGLFACSGSSFEVGAASSDTGASDDSATDTSGVDTALEDSGVGSDTSDSSVELESGSGDAVASEGGTTDAVVSTCKTNADCPALHRCERASCAAVTGTCKAVVLVSAAYDPVCGCEGVTFWNKQTAMNRGDPAKHAGPCTLGEASSCTGTGCAVGGGRCVHEVGSSGACSTGTGQCWSLPASTSCAGAPADTIVPTQPCGSGKCLSRCESVLAGGSTPFYASACSL